jgi:ferredoxin
VGPVFTIRFERFTVFKPPALPEVMTAIQKTSSAIWSHYFGALSHQIGKEVIMAKFKVVLEREEGTACKSCVDSCPDSFEMADDGLAHVKGSTRVGSNDELNLDDLGCKKEAAEGCPVNIIHIFEGGKKII